MTKFWRGVVILSGMAGIASAQAQTAADPYNYSRTSSFTYDSTTGLLATEKMESGQSGVVTTYQYDGYGNKKSASTANDAGATGNAVFATRSSSYTYDAQTVTLGAVSVTTPAGTFQTTQQNALGKSETRTYDPRFGTPSSLLGPNQLTTSWQADDFGRTVRENHADGTYVLTAYCFIGAKVGDTSSNSSNCPAPGSNEIPGDAASFTYVVPYDKAGNPSGPFLRTYVDGMGRKLRTVTEAFDGATQPGGAARLVVQDTDYSPQGTVLVTTQPYFLDTGSSTTAGGHYGMSTTVYDALGRATAVYVTDPKGSQAGVVFGSRAGGYQASMTRFTYNGLNTTTVNDKGQSRTEEKNVNGKVVRVTDALGAQVAYQYDAFDNLVQTKDALQNVVTMTYDIRGRKLSVNDPDTGLWKYDYDALGELVWQESANQRALGQSTTMAYDVLGRMVQRVEKEYTSNWYFDTYADGSACNMGTGKLCESRTTNGVYRKYFYDSLGRAISTRTDISGGPSFAGSVSYDDVTGRLASQTYPTGLKVNLNYTGRGYLSTLTLATAATVNPLPATAGGTPGPSSTLAAGSVLWKGVAYNAWGKAEQQTFGNNVVSTAAFDALTGRVATATAGLGSATAVMNYSYVWDSLNHLSGRTDGNGDGSTGAVTDSFIYDDVGRLTSYTIAGLGVPGSTQQRTVTLQYNALGMMLSKSDVGTYGYQAQGAGVVHPHALQSVSGTFNSGYTYDANGNLKTSSGGSYRGISYTSFNLPDADSQSGGLAGPSGGPRYAWQYDENHQRIKETEVTSAGTRTTWMVHPDNAGGLSFEYEQGPAGTSSRHYLTAGGMAIGVLAAPSSVPTLAAGQTAPTALSSIVLNKVEYWHKDHLGSLVATTDHAGALTARYAYDPFGKRRSPGGSYDANGTLVYDWNKTNSGTDRGFTGHEHLDDVGVIHMNGRLFDPRVGVFMQGDPFVQDMLNLQNFNRYGYCYNNPMTCTDPSGMLFGGMFKVPVIDNLWNHHIKPALPMIAAIVASYYMGTWALNAYSESEAAAAGFSAAGATEAGSAEFYALTEETYVSTYAAASSSVTGGMIGGAAGGFAGSFVASNGNLDAAFKGAINGAIGGGINGYFGSKYSISRVAANGVAGGMGSVLRGGSFSDGFRSSTIISSLTYLNSMMRSNMIEQSMKDPRNDGTGWSKGMFGDGFKLGGGRWFVGAENAEGCSPLGCWQNGPGTVFGRSYSSGGLQDMIVESFAGPHDTANSPWWYINTEEQAVWGLGGIGDALPASARSAFMNSFLEYTTNYTTSLAFAAPFAASAILEQSWMSTNLGARKHRD